MYKTVMQKGRMKEERTKDEKTNKGRKGGSTKDRRKNCSRLNCRSDSTSVYTEERKHKTKQTIHSMWIWIYWSGLGEGKIFTLGLSASCSFISCSINLRWDNLFHLLFYALWLFFRSLPRRENERKLDLFVLWKSMISLHPHSPAQSIFGFFPCIICRS